MPDTTLLSNALTARQALWSLQKELLNSLKAQFDQEIGKEAAAIEWFQALMNSDRYIWLRELTSLMADIDIMTELESIDEEHAAIARFEIERLLFNQDASRSAFAQSYSDLLTSGLSLLPLHSQLRAALQSLPSKKYELEHAVSERKKWHDEHRQQSRKKRN